MTFGPALRRPLTGQLVAFGLIGAASTVVHLGGFLLLHQVLTSAQLANATALLVAAVANTWANRRWTFGVQGRDGAARHQLQGLVVLALTLAMTSGGLRVLDVIAPEAPTWLETGAVAVTTATATAVKFLAMRWWVFRPSRPPASAPDRPTVHAPTLGAWRRWRSSGRGRWGPGSHGCSARTAPPC